MWITNCMNSGKYETGKHVQRFGINKLKSIKQTNNIDWWIISGLSSIVATSFWWWETVNMGSSKLHGAECPAICCSLCVFYQYSMQFVFVWNSSALACLWFWAFAQVLPKAAILYWLWLTETPRNLTVKAHLNWLLFDGAISREVACQVQPWVYDENKSNGTLVFIWNSFILQLIIFWCFERLLGMKQLCCVLRFCLVCTALNNKTISAFRFFFVRSIRLPNWAQLKCSSRTL